MIIMSKITLVTYTQALILTDVFSKITSKLHEDSKCV